MNRATGVSGLVARLLTLSFACSLVLVGLSTAPVAASAALPTVFTSNIENENGISNLDVDHSQTADRTKVQGFHFNGTKAQLWTFYTVGIINGSSVFNIKSNLVPNGPGRTTGKCLDNDHGSTQNGNQVQLFQCNGGNAQLWLQVDTELRNGAGDPLTPICLDLDHQKPDDGTKIQVYQCNGTPAQHWFYAA
jgi:Ricin-type beta-trefoil lectin domain